MAKMLNVGDHVSWNSGAGRVSGRIVRVHTTDVRKGYIHHASKDDPQYEIESDKTSIPIWPASGGGTAPWLHRSFSAS
jgi:hypothetical protein